MKTRRKVLKIRNTGLKKSIFSSFPRAKHQIRSDAPTTADVRPEVAALIERNMNERPDLWADLA